MSKSYLTPNQVAKLLLVSPTAVRQWAERGDLNALTTPGGHRRFLLSEVKRFANVRGVALQHQITEQLKLLIVDDDLAYCGYLTEMLALYQQQLLVNVAHDGFTAGQLVSEIQPNVILLDLRMPNMNGIEVCRQLKSDPQTQGIDIIAMTGFANEQNIFDILTAGARTCLIKPMTKQQLLTELGLVISTKTPHLLPVA